MKWENVRERQEEKRALVVALTEAVIETQRQRVEEGKPRIVREVLFLSAVKFAATCGCAMVGDEVGERREQLLRYAKATVRLLEAEIEKGDQLTQEETRKITAEVYGEEKVKEALGDGEFVLPELPGVH